MRIRLHHRLALPFAAMAVVLTATATFIAVSGARHWVDEGRRGDAASTARLLQRVEYAGNPAIVRIAADLTGVEVLTMADGGVVVASTFDGDVPAEVRALVESGRPESCGSGCFVSYADVIGAPGMVVVVIAGLDAADPLLASLVNSIWLAGLVGVVLLVGTSGVLARAVTARVQHLVEFTTAAAQDTTQRAAEGADEIGRLGAAFNALLERLDEKRQALMRSEKLAVAGLMAARVAHDVRNPLSSIKMQTQLLQAQVPATSEEAAVLGAILRDVNQLDAVVGDLLETARPEEPRLEQVSLPELMRSAARAFEGPLAHRRITLITDLGDGGRYARVDPARMRRVLSNVLSNAAEATRAGGVIRVSTRLDVDTHVIVVEDDGVGIAADLRARVFDPFVSTKPDGVGLGLVNARAIVASHGGTIEVAPRVPHGTLVTIRLPAGAPHG